MTRPALELADIVRRHGPAYRQAHRLPLEQLRPLRAIEACRTAELGGHVEQCSQCDYTRILYNSCRNRLRFSAALSQVPGARPRPLAPKTQRRIASGGVFPRRFHSAGSSRRHGSTEQKSRLRRALSRRRPNAAHHRRRSTTSRRCHRLLRHPPHLGPEPPSSSPSALCGPRRRHLASRRMGFLPRRFLSSRESPLSPLSDSLSRKTATVLRLRQTTLSRRVGLPAAASRLCPIHPSARQHRLGGLRQAALGWPRTGAGLSRPLHSPCRYLQRPSGQPG